MPDRTKKLLADIATAATSIQSFVGAATLAEYSGNRLLRSAVERQFEILGEALRRLEAVDPATAARINEYRRIIAFRNILAHGYDSIDDNIVWQAIQEKIPILQTEVQSLRKEGDGPRSP